MLTEPHAKPTEQFRAELEEARRAFEELGDDAALATVWTELAMIEWMPCRFHRATLAADHAIEHARRSGDKRLLDKAFVPLIAGGMFGFSTPDEGLRTLDELADDMAGSRLHETVLLAVRRVLLAMLGSIEEARHQLSLADEDGRIDRCGFRAVGACGAARPHRALGRGRRSRRARLPPELREPRGGGRRRAPVHGRGDVGQSAVRPRALR